MKSVLLITADSFRYDHLSSISSKEDTTPFLDSFADVRFDNAIATGSGTSSAFPGLLASALPMDYGYRGINDQHVPLAAQLQENGVETVGISASTHVSSLYGYDRGFETFIEDPAIADPGFKERLISTSIDIGLKIPVIRDIGRYLFRHKRQAIGPSDPYRQADEITDIALREIRKRDGRDRGRQFFWVGYMEPHSPPTPPEFYVNMFQDDGWTVADLNELWRRWWDERPKLWSDETTTDATEIFTAEEEDVIQAFYRAQIRFLDDEIERLITTLEDEGLLEETLVLFTSDHGEEFFDHGDLSHRQKLYEELIHVPFLARQYGADDVLSATGREDTLISHLDIAPTVADALDVPRPKKWRGTPLRELVAGEHERSYVISELCHSGIEDGFGGDVNPDKAVISVRNETEKFILNEQKEEKELYDLETDRAEQESLPPDVIARSELRERAHDRLEAVSKQKATGVSLSDDIKDQLSHLGYAE